MRACPARQRCVTFRLAVQLPSSYSRQSPKRRNQHMARPTPHEALIYLMVVTSASDRDMTDVELQRIGEVVRSWPIFEDFPPDRLLQVAQDCQKLVAEENGLEEVLRIARKAVPEHLHDT